MAEKNSKTNQEMRKINGLKSLASGISFLVYLAVIMYMEYHFLNLISQFLGEDASIVGYVVIAASFLTAIALPLGLHYWFRSGTQQLVGFIFYGLHFVIMFVNLVLDSNATKYGAETGEFQGFLDFYGVWILPGYIAFYALAWSILWFSDDGSKAIDKKREAMASEEEAGLDRRMAVSEMQSTALSNAFQSPAAKTAINQWAAQNAPALLAAELGMTMEELGVHVGDDFRFWMPESEGQRIYDKDGRLVGKAEPFRSDEGGAGFVRRPTTNGLGRTGTD